MRRPLTVGLLLAAALASPLVLSAQVEIVARGARVTVGGRLHTQYATSSVGEVVEDIFIRRARLEVDVALGEIVRGRVTPDFAGGRTALQDAYLQLDLDPVFRLSFGQFKRAFSTFELHSSTDLPLIERDGRIPGLSVCEGVDGVCTFSRLTQRLELDGRDVGVRAEGTSGRVSYQVSVTNGQGINVPDVNDGKSVSGRLVVRPTGRIAVAAFGGLHDYLDDDDATQRAGSLGADLEIGAFRNGFHLLAAVVGGENWRVDEDTSFRAAQALATWYFRTGSSRLEGVEPLFRLSWGDPHDDGEDDSGILFTPGLTVYFQGRNALGANVDVYSPGGDAGSEWSLKVQSFLYF